jgi:TatD DNase family protein
MTQHCINIHSHGESRPGTLVDVLKNFENIPAEGFFSAGMHPWYLNDFTEEEFERLKSACLKENVLAVGECGLDKMCETDMALQQTWFAEQIKLANEINKPLVIHCVRAYEEVMHALKDVRVPVIFHGYNKNENVAHKLLEHGYSLSFGKHLWSEHTAEVFKHCPKERFFLETDDSTHSIEEVYERAAMIRSVAVEEIQKQVMDNVEKIFGRKFAAYDE